MKLGEFLKPNIIKLIIALVLGIITFWVGRFWFNNPIFLKTGCAPNLGCPGCEICMSWGFPEIINLYSLPLLALLYVVSSGIYSIAKEKNKSFELNIITSVLIIICIFIFLGYSYYVNWKSRCRAFTIDYSLDNTFQRQIELKCPQFFNPFSWSEFQEEWERQR